MELHQDMLSRKGDNETINSCVPVIKDLSPYVLYLGATGPGAVLPSTYHCSPCRYCNEDHAGESEGRCVNRVGKYRQC